MKVRTIQELIGRNVRDIRARHSLRQEDVARAARERGLRWNVSRVGELERGQLGVSLQAAVQLAQALSDIAGEPLTLSGLLDGEARLDVAGYDYDSADFRTVLEGGLIADLKESGDGGDPNSTVLLELRELSEKIRESENAMRAIRDRRRLLGWDDGRNEIATKRAAAKLGRPVADVAEMAHRLFTRSFTEERDRIAGPNASAQRRGIVTRDLVGQLQDGFDSVG